LSFESDWQNQLKRKLANRGIFHQGGGADYFLFRKGLWSDIPPFAIGRTMWDNWLIYSALKRNMPVIDATEVITAVHQNHKSFYPVGRNAVLKGPEGMVNRKLAGWWCHAFPVQASNYIITKDGIKKKTSLKFFFHYIETFPILHPFFKPLYWIMRPFFWAVRKIKDIIIRLRRKMWQ
jgi:hypothetical protein